MPLGKASRTKLEDATPEMRAFALAVAAGVDEGDLAHVGVTDVTVETVFRDKATQNAAVARGASKTPWPRSAHNVRPCKAIDMLPYPVEWAKGEAYAKKVWALHCYGAGVAHAMGIDLRGISWDGPHFEQVEP